MQAECGSTWSGWDGRSPARSGRPTKAGIGKVQPGWAQLGGRGMAMRYQTWGGMTWQT